MILKSWTTVLSEVLCALEIFWQKKWANKAKSKQWAVECSVIYWMFIFSAVNNARGKKHSNSDSEAHFLKQDKGLLQEASQREVQCCRPWEVGLGTVRPRWGSAHSPAQGLHQHLWYFWKAVTAVGWRWSRICLQSPEKPGIQLGLRINLSTEGSPREVPIWSF